MTATPVTEATAPVAGLPGAGRWRGRLGLAAGVLVLVGAAIVLVVTDPFSGGGRSSGAVSDNAYATSVQRVQRESISQQTQVSATLGYAGDLTIRLPAGTVPSSVTQAQRQVTSDGGTLATAQSTLSADDSALAQVRATLAAAQQQEAVDCSGANAAQSPGSAAGSGPGSSGSCATDAQSVSSEQQAVTTGAAKITADQGSVSSARRALAADQAALASARRAQTVYSAESTYTSLPSAGEIVRRGQQIYAIDGDSVLLLYGPTVATRAFLAGMSPGTDVAELNANLDALGYGRRLSGDAFTVATRAAIDRLQAAHGEPQTGELLLGSVVFEPGAIRVTSVPSSVAVGSSVTAGAVLSASWITRQVSIALDAALEGQIKVGDPLSITLPDNQTTSGRISYVSPVASTSQTASTIQVDAVPTDPDATGNLDQAPVNVSIMTASASNVLVVPVDALLALSSGGYAVEEITHTGKHYLVPVTTGLFDDANGVVQVSGRGLAAGQRVVVPGQ